MAVGPNFLSKSPSNNKVFKSFKTLLVVFDSLLLDLLNKVFNAWKHFIYFFIYYFFTCSIAKLASDDLRILLLPFFFKNIACGLFDVGLTTPKYLSKNLFILEELKAKSFPNCSNFTS